MSAAAFWKYFVQKEAALRDTTVSKRLISEFERRLHAVVETDWEIGPADNEGRARLSLSPSPIDAIKVQKVRELLQAAPELPAWELTFYKPPRQWDLKFSIVANDVEHEIDASRWEFVLYAFEDGTVDILFRPDKTCRQIEQPALEHAATVIADGELGERLRMEKVRDIEVVVEWPRAEKKSAQRLRSGLLAQMIDLAADG